MKKAIILFSGGKDSLLCATRFLDEGYRCYLVTYNNGNCIGEKATLQMAKRLKKKYGRKYVKIVGIINISALFRSFINPFYNYPCKDVYKRYGSITVSQFNCLACRCAMYTHSIILAKSLGITEVVDGARVCQLFAIEQEKMLDRFRELFARYDLTLKFPVKDLEDDWECKNELLARGIIPKVYEHQCLIGTPLRTLNKKVLKGTMHVYEDYLYDKILRAIALYQDINFNDVKELF